MTEKKISIIIPVYNVEKYMRRCLDSLVNQTYKNIEIIVVNDGSTDRTADIVEEYVEQYPGKVRLFSKQNEGQAEARNFGLTKASGEYIGFVDSDDFVSTRMYELLYQEAEKTGCDLVTCGYYGCDDVTGEITVYQTGYRGEFNQSIYENPMILRVNSPYPWNKLYSRELLERSGFHFQKGMIFEDLCAIFPLFLDARKVGRVHEKLYYYIKGRKGGTISTFNEKHGQILDALRIMNEAYLERGMFDKFRDTLLFFNIRHIYARFDEMKTYEDVIFKREFKKRAFALLDKYFPEWKESEEFAAQQKPDMKPVREEETVEEPAESQAGEGASRKVSARGGEKAKKRSERFEELVAESRIEKNMVLVECYHGNDVRGMGYCIAKGLMQLGGYQVYIAVADAGKEARFLKADRLGWNYVDMTSDRYLEILAQAEFVINNRSFPGFYRKRKEQHFIFTDFLPSLLAQGTGVTYGTRNMQGIQLSLAQADQILFPEELKDEFSSLLDAYNMAEICRDKGFFVPFQYLFGRQKEEKDEGGRPLIKVAYMPSLKEYPGVKDVKCHLFLSDLKKKLSELDEQIEEGRKIYVCFPRTIRRRFRENIWKNVEFFPENTEPLEFLANCDAVIGEYEPEMYVMKAFGKPVCQFVTNRDDVAWSAGLCDSAHEFPVFESAAEAAEWVNQLDGLEPGKKPLVMDCKIDVRELKKGRNRRVGRSVVYMPRFRNKNEFMKFMEKQDVGHSVFFIEKDTFGDDMAAWIRSFGGIRYIVIIRSLVVSRNESRLIKYRITTKDKLRQKRDRQRYLG